MRYTITETRVLLSVTIDDAGAIEADYPLAREADSKDLRLATSQNDDVCRAVATGASVQRNAWKPIVEAALGLHDTRSYAPNCTSHTDAVQAVIDAVGLCPADLLPKNPTK